MQSDADAIERGAVISDYCGLYRYLLWREWNDRLPAMCFVMLNPSTADGEQDDNTVRRCLYFARREGCGRLNIVNLFAYRSTDPGQLLVAADPVGPDNDRFLFEAQSVSQKVIVAWGAVDRRLYKRVAAVEKMFPGAVCLGRTKYGYPVHPLRIRSDSRLSPYNVGVI